MLGFSGMEAAFIDIGDLNFTQMAHGGVPHLAQHSADNCAIAAGGARGMNPLCCACQVAGPPRTRSVRKLNLGRTPSPTESLTPNFVYIT
jgi:hypothetical protein